MRGRLTPKGGAEPGKQRAAKGKKQRHDSIMRSSDSKAAQGTSKAYTLRRLARERPDLLAAIVILLLTLPGLTRWQIVTMVLSHPGPTRWQR